MEDNNSVYSKYCSFKQHAYIIINGTHTWAGKLFDLLLLFFIISSSLLVMLESVQIIDARFHTMLIVLEWLITIFFTIEYILRIISHQHPWRYIFSFYGIIDLLALLPMYLSFVIPGSKVLATVRIVRLLRIFRILALAHFTEEANALKTALKASRTKIFIFIYFVLVICVLLGTLMYLVEGRTHGFTSIPRSIYWCIVTLTTVGYGDIAPATTLGQVVASIIMIMGYGIIAVPTGIVSSEYSRIQEEKQEKKNQQALKTLPRMCASCGETRFPHDAVYCHKCGHLL